MNYKGIILYLLLLFQQSTSQTPEWMAFCGGTCVYGFLCKEDTVWIHTTGGIAKLNAVTEKMEFYNTGNSELKSNHVRALALDSAGSLWAGTNNGISRYNGYEWKKYTNANYAVSPYYINFIAVDKDNTIWAGSCFVSTISIFNGTEWKYYYAIAPSAPYNSIESIIPDWRGKTLAGSSWGILYAGKDTSITDTALGDFSVTDMIRDSIDNIWISTEWNGIYYFDGTIKKNFDSTNSGLPSNGVYGLCYDTSNKLYAITRKHLLQYENGVWIVRLLVNDITPHSDVFSSVSSDNKGNIWLGTAFNYCYKWDGKQVKQYHPFNWPHQLCSRSIGIDSKGRCWAGNWLRGELNDTMIYFNGKAWHKLGFQKAHTILDSLSFKKICDMDSLKIWVDSTCALVYNTGSWYCYTIGDRYGHGSEVKRDRKGGHWFASGYGLWRFNNNGNHLFTKENSSLPGTIVEKIAIDSLDNVWISCCNNDSIGVHSWLVLLKDTTFTSIRTCNPNYGISDIEIDFAENIWFSETLTHTAGIQFGHGIFKMNGNNLQNFTVSNSHLSSNTVFDLSLSKNNTLWITAYAKGIDTLSITDGTWGHFIVENSHIADNDITQIEFDARDNKWLKSHLAGITVYRKGGIDFQTSIEPLPTPSKKTIIKAIIPFSIKNAILYFATPARIAATISLYSVSGRRIAYFDKKIYAPGVHCLPLRSDNISQSVLIAAIAAENRNSYFMIFNVNR